ncbi:MAG: helix-turn-helix domain-containing protein [Fimbriimonadaceae bacterium]|nr:helix-turn-helix domain-containing protein [Fimbriimonadaceae bacterium]
METYGTLVKRLRMELGIGLRDFCLAIGTDPSNYSKIERGKLPPPEPGSKLFGLIIEVLRLEKDSEHEKELLRLASLGRGTIPETVLQNERVGPFLPAFFRTLDGGPISDEERDALIKVIQES